MGLSLDVGCHDEKSGSHVSLKKSCDKKGVTAPTTSPLHILKGYISADVQTKKINHLRFEIII